MASWAAAGFLRSAARAYRRRGRRSPPRGSAIRAKRSSPRRPSPGRPWRRGGRAGRTRGRSGGSRHQAPVRCWWGRSEYCRPRGGSCRKAPGALYVESSEGLSSLFACSGGRTPRRSGTRATRIAVTLRRRPELPVGLGRRGRQRVGGVVDDVDHAAGLRAPGVLELPAVVHVADTGSGVLAAGSLTTGSPEVGKPTITTRWPLEVDTGAPLSSACTQETEATEGCRATNVSASRRDRSQ